LGSRAIMGIHTATAITLTRVHTTHRRIMASVIGRIIGGTVAAFITTAIIATIGVNGLLGSAGSWSSLQASRGLVPKGAYL